MMEVAAGSSSGRRWNREYDEEEVMVRWAALEKLPTYDRLRKGILMTASGRLNEVDVFDLGVRERRTLLQRLVNGACQQDNHTFLLKLKDRIERVRIKLPTIEVRFEHLNVEAEAYVGSRALPTVTNFFLGIIQGCLNAFPLIRSKKKRIPILKDVSGVIKPCRLTLLLGPPGSGKTTLLLALAGKLGSDLKTTGRVTYNGHSMNEFVPQRTAAYISQYDVHIGCMTVRETLTFSAKCQGVGSRYEMLSELLRRERTANITPDPDIDVYMKAAATEGQEANVVIDYILKILGLEVCADTMIGDDMVRGISGGQKKRVTTGEILVGPVIALFMDEISTGLDSSTTYQIVNSLKEYVHILSGTVVISLLQPAPETYDLFDDIILISDGQIVYQGPRELVLNFFESTGFRCPERKGVADFLQEVTSRKDQQQYWANKYEPYRFVTVGEFSDAFKSFHVGRELENELRTPFDRTKNHHAALATKKYGIGMKDLLKANLAREYLFMKRNSFIFVFKTAQLTIMAFVLNTLFLRTNMHRDNLTDGGIYIGALFYAIYIVAFNGVYETGMAVFKLPVFYKQRDLLFYPSWPYALASWILRIPITTADITIWVCVTYYVIGYDPNVGRFFKQYLLLLVLSLVVSGLFRLIAAVGRNLTIATLLALFVLLMIFALDGVILSQADVKKWWKWGYWSSPMMYAQSAVVVNEFFGKSWSEIPPGTHEPLGIQVLKSRGFFPHAYWYWIGVGALFGFLLLYNFCIAVALAYLNPYSKGRAVKAEDTEDATLGIESTLLAGSSSERTHTENGEAIGMPPRSSTTIYMQRAAVEVNKQRRVALPFPPHSITFDEITYSVDMPPEMKSQGVVEDKLVLLKGVSGSFRPGVLTALMGVSGAGKTTLLDVLSGRKTTGYIQGDITISGYPKKQETFTRISGYCEQNDIHSPHVTVYESLLYSAWLRLPSEVDSQTRKMFVEEVMELVELNPLRQALVGLPGVDGLSTEQRKRLTIAVEIVANPSIVFMDEPTSGLDARAAAIVMRTIRNTVDTGRTVVCTIHQPSIDIFEAFDEIFLMKTGGQEIYVGPLGRHSSQLINYFEGIEGVSKIKDGYNPATWMLEVTAMSQEIASGVDFSDLYKRSELYKRTKELIRELSAPSPGSKDLHFSTRYPQSFLMQCLACLWKLHWSYWRNPSYTALRLLTTVATALMIGTMFLDLGSRTATRQDLSNVMGSMFVGVIFLGSQNSYTVQPVVFVERTVFYRELGAGMYSALPYAFAQVLIEVPYILLQAMLYTVIVYPLMGFRWTAAKLLWYLFFTFFSMSYYTLCGMMTIALSPNIAVSAMLTSSIFSMWSLFSGFVIPRKRIPIWWRWCYWASPTAWTLYGLVVSQYGDLHDIMDDTGGMTVEQYIRDYYSFDHDFLRAVACVVVGIALLFATSFTLSMAVFNFQSR